MVSRFRELELCWEQTMFCSCLPWRIGASLATLLGILFGGILSALLYSEIARTGDMTSTERAGFVVAGIMETVFFVVSVFGFAGTFSRKPSLVQIYVYFTAAHFILNIGATTYLLYVVAHFTTRATDPACERPLRNGIKPKDRCTASLTVSESVYFAIGVIVLLIELYGVLFVGHYGKQLKRHERTPHNSRIVEAMRPVFREKEPQYLSLPSDGQIAKSLPLPSHYSIQSYNPYEEITQSQHEAGPSFTSHETPALPVEAGYGGGLWTHEDISAEEKARLKKRDDEMGFPGLAAPVVDEYEELNRSEKSPMGSQPPTIPTQMEDLPVYALRGPPGN